MERIACSWCHYENEPGRTSCGTCGAPLDVANPVSESGWQSAPRLREMAEFRVGNITCQIAGQVVPVAEFTLAEGDTIFFEQHTLLWKERTVSLTGKNLKQRGQRMIAGMPHAVIEAQGPDRIAVSRDASGEVVVLPLHPEVETDVRGHAFLAASANVGYDFIRIEKLASMFHGGPRDVPGPVRGQPGPGAVAAARVRQRVPAPAGPRRKDPGRAGRVPLQGRPGHHSPGPGAEGHRIPARELGGTDRPGTGRDPVDVRPPAH